VLYATTRSDHDTYTAQRALKEPNAPDGGLYIPMRLKKLSAQELDLLLDQGTAGILAALMNYFFSSRLSYKDVEFAIGKHIARLVNMSHRITIAECWRNPDGDFSRIEHLLTKLVAVDKMETPVGEWMKVACRIAALFCIYAGMKKDGTITGERIDVAVRSDDFSAPMAVWYARAMGLPVGNILYCCNEKSVIWDFLHRGEIGTDENIPLRDVCPPGLERLIRVCLGRREAVRFAACQEEGMSYDIGKEFKTPFPGMYASVISRGRIPQVISNVRSTNGYQLCSRSAILYAGVMDYRANTGCSGPVLLISETRPEQ